MKGKWLAAAKAAISILLIWYLLDRVDVAKVLARVRRLDVLEAAMALGVLVAQAGLVTVRWWMVARITETALSLVAALRILLIGMFFNQTLPSSVGGDAVRVWLVTREGPPLGKAVNVVLCDRVLALVVLIGLIGASLPAIYTRVADDTTRTALLLLVGISAGGMAIFLALGERVAALLRRWRFTRPFGQLASDFRLLFTRPASASGLMLLSAFIHIMTIATVTLLAWGLELSVGFVDAFAIVPTVLLLTTLPISVAGWGVREGAMIAGFGFVGIPADDALALSVLFGVAQIVIAMPGGLVWLADRPRAGSQSLADGQP